MTVAEDTSAADEFYDVEEEGIADQQTGDASCSVEGESYPLHRAAFSGDVLRIQQLLATMTPEQQRQLDPHGNNALHVAAWRRMHRSVEALLAGGFPVVTKSSRGWNALDEALAAKDRELAHMLQRAAIAQARVEMKARRVRLLETMREMPDFSMQLKWELGSTVPGLGMLLRRYAPHDLYHIWKVGDRLRVDGSLMGLDTSSSLIPEWKRGHFSLVFDGSNCSTSSTSTSGSNGVGISNGISISSSSNGTHHSSATSSSNGSGGGSTAGASPRLLFLNRGKQHYINVGADKKAMKESEDDDLAAELDAELDELMDRDVDRTRFKASDLRFAPVKGWLGGEQTEKVEGWSCKVYEATGKIKSVSTFKAAFSLPAGASFDDYLRARVPEDPKNEAFFDPLSPGGMAGPPGHGASSSGREAGAAGEAEAAEAAEAASVSDAAVLEAEPAALAHSHQNGSDGSSSSSSSRAPSSKRSLWRAPKHPPPDASTTAAAARSAGAASTSSQGTDAQPSGKQRVIRARCWMARDFPMSLQQLLPLLEVIGTANKQLAKVGKFMDKYSAADSSLFPVKVNVPLLMTVYALVSFKHFKELPPGGTGGLEPGFFDVPSGFSRKNLADVMDKFGGGPGGRGPGRFGGGGGKRQALRTANGRQQGEDTLDGSGEEDDLLAL